MSDVDHIVVGGGAAGCVVAARLVREQGARVLLLEAGSSHHHPLLDMPPGIFKMINGSKFMRYHQTEPQAHLGGRVHDIPQGHVLGGGTSVNAQVYMRGRPEDYDDWDRRLAGNAARTDWSWQGVLEHFRRMEDNDRLVNEHHGRGGPLKVSDPGHVDVASRWFIQAAQAAGLPYNGDFNGERQTGVGFYQFMNRAGKRCSAAYAYVEPLREHPGLEVALDCEVQQVLVEDGCAVGVEYRDRKGKVHRVRAQGEVILAAGALVTPKLLMLSGIGPAEQLAQHDIAVKADLPGVGQNLIDHPEVPITAYARTPCGYYRQGVGWRMLANGLQFKLFGSGPVTSAGVEAGAFVNPVDPQAAPTIQAFCVPIVYLDRDTRDALKDDYGLTVTTVVVKPKARGSVCLRSADPGDMPRVSPNLLGHPDDIQAMVDGQKFFLRAFEQSPLKENLHGVALPFAGSGANDDELLEHCRRFVKTNYHPAGTAAMGADDDPMAVLDARLRVRGVRGLRVCDMSAVPDIPAGNTTAPAMMLGSRCADFIGEDAGLGQDARRGAAAPETKVSGAAMH
ncbi:GMC family oxidoreductase N-terminal domain-containing protein [Halomonas sp. DP1Y21-3]|uniref:GMC family oxidoreductase n=1 Tax=Halomonas sp. DP1Y21-3 TaxID=2859080 RepID=UPI001C97DEDF|nr:GMC family oxidoreductase N-terminal domain-containing protein [Halomonas sp. DP1Y21-3]MBY6108827.1 GMC family oxidoreductase N-terminal domain-containing protein [Halomonas sp. DP1Y21-3]